MVLYRVKQFIWGFTSFFKNIDYEYVNEFLNEDEIKIFNKLKHNDKHHCIRVCKDSIKMKEDFNIDVDKYKLGKAALLHDVGKSKMPLSIFEKSVVVLLDKATSGKIKKYDKIKQIDIYYNHPKNGLEVLKNFKYDKELLEVVRYHHNNNNISDNKLLNIIRESDDKN